MRVHGLDILRPTGATELISARTFEPAFVDGLASHVSIRSVPVDEWLAPLFGAGDVPRPLAAARLREATEAAFLAPAQRALALAPELTRLRNLGGAAVRMLIIAHAPGAFLPEWALLEPLLRPGDRIVAPSRRAAEVLARLCPDLSRFVRVVPHPIPPLPAASCTRVEGARRLMSLSRVVAGKLVHRQVEAMAILRRRGWNDLHMDIAGPLNELGAQGLSAYVRSIQAKIRRLELDDRVALLGVVDDDAAKAELLGGAALLLNLSVTVEESFGKSIVEANGCGVPCLVTDWGGLAEAVGDAGLALPVERHAYGVDVSAERIADAIETLLRAPPSPEQCRRQAARSAPERAARCYRELLDEALAELHTARAIELAEPPASAPATPRRGLLAATAPLTALRWAEAMDMHQQEVLREPDLRGLGRPELLLPGAQLRGLLTLGVMSEVQRAQAGLPTEEGSTQSPEPSAMPEGDFLARCSWAARNPGTRSSRVVCLNLLYQLGHHDEVRDGLACLRAEGLDSPGMRYLAVELERIGGNASTAVAAALAADDDAPWSEHESHRVLQLARIHRDAGHVDDARVVLERWLERHPDGPEAADAWQLLAVCRLQSGTELGVARARDAIERALALRGPWPELERLAAMLQSADDDR